MTRLILCLLVSVIAAWADGQVYTINTVAGSDWVGDQGPGTSAILLQAEGIAADSTGNLYIADALDHRVRQVTPAGLISTIAGTGVPGLSGDGGPAAAAQLNSPYGLAFDGSGNLYIADLGNARVRRVDADGIITTIAGGGSVSAGGVNEGNAGINVSLIAPRNLALDGFGGIYISDFGGHCVYRLRSDGSLTTLAGTGIRGFSGDGLAASSAQLAYPAGLAMDRVGALYIADSQNHRIRKVLNGIISTFASASIPTGLAFDGLGSLYIADPSAGQIIQMPINAPTVAIGVDAVDIAIARGGYLFAIEGSALLQVSFTGPSPVIAGGGNLAYGDNGPATVARLNHPSGVAADSLGTFYIADRDNNRIRMVAPNGTITTIGGTGVAGYIGDGGMAAQAQLNAPTGVSIDAAGNLYIADTGNQRVREITPAGLILPITSTGLVSPVYAVADAALNVYISDSGNGTIVKVSAGGVMTTLLDSLQLPGALALDAAGDLYFTEAAVQQETARVSELATSGARISLGAGLWNEPRGIAVNAAGEVFVADTGLQQVIRIDLSGQVTMVAGNGAAGFSGDGGAALSAALNSPWGLAADSVGNLYIADFNNNRVRILSPAAPVAVPVTAPAPVAAPVVIAANAASLQPGPLVPGMLLALIGTGLSAADISNTQVFFSAIPAPILSADSTSLVVQVPPQILVLQNVQIDILHFGNTLAQIPAIVTLAAPALFADSSGQAAANNQDGTLNSAANPAPRGSVIVLYGTGEGISGSPISVSIGGYSAQILYAGSVAGYPGLLQINAVVPTGYLPSGAVQVTVTAGLVVSQPGVTISID